MKELVRIYFIQGQSRAIHINPGEWKGVLRVKFHELRFKVQGIPHLHGKTFQEIEPVISSKDTGHSSGRLGSDSPDQVEKRKPTKKREFPFCTGKARESYNPSSTVQHFILKFYLPLSSLSVFSKSKFAHSAVNSS